MRPDETGWPWGFRHKASFVFGESADRRNSVIGHHGASSPVFDRGEDLRTAAGPRRGFGGGRRIVPIVECPVHAPRANRIAFALHAHLARARVTAAGPALRGILRHFIVRTTAGGGEAVAMLVVTRNDKSLRTPIRALLAGPDAADGFFLNIHDRPGPYMVGRETIRIAGRNHVRESVGGVSFLISPTAFFQTNVEAAELLLQLALEHAPVDPPLRILDLYAGSGLFSLPLAARGHHVTAVEDNAQAMKDANANVRLNRLPAANVRLHASRVEDALQRMQRETFDLVILDPPRPGCPAEVLDAVFGRIRAAKVIYVSCNPTALAAELPRIVAAGYRIRSVQPVDMFPHTTHIESVVVLQRP
jgi:23S rRNA (uracil1939-C5)-methyltransferase